MDQRQTDLATLGLEGDPTPDELKARFRELARALHPDRGGDVDQFVEVREAYQRAWAHARRPRRCQACDGDGKNVIGRGFLTATSRCSPCGGRGTVTR